MSMDWVIKILLPSLCAPSHKEGMLPLKLDPSHVQFWGLCDNNFRIRKTLIYRHTFHNIAELKSICSCTYGVLKIPWHTEAGFPLPPVTKIENSLIFPGFFTNFLAYFWLYFKMASTCLWILTFVSEDLIYYWSGR